jgi:hypothetical protein
MSRAKNLANLIGGASAGTSGMALPSGTTAQRPSSAIAGTIRNNTSSGLLEFYTGTEWKPVGSVYDTDSTSTGYFDLPSGTTGQRPASPQAGMMRYNTTTGYPEWFSPTDNNWYNFNQSRDYSIEFLVVAGGGSGGSGWEGSGGGAGGLRYVSSSAITVGTSYSVTIGAGGGAQSANYQPGVNGSDSTFNDITSTGGGGGGQVYSTVDGSIGKGRNGGSGGGTSRSVGAGVANNNPGLGNTPSTSPSQGNNGGKAPGDFTGGSGGGGAGGVGADITSNNAGGAGGIGAQYSQFASVGGSPSGWFAGGGGGNSDSGGVAGGQGGGGAGATNAHGTAGTANTGGGGGGCRTQGYTSGAGGSGIVIIRYAGSQRGSGGTITSSGGYTIHTFTTSGTFTG